MPVALEAGGRHRRIFYCEPLWTKRTNMSVFVQTLGPGGFPLPKVGPRVDQAGKAHYLRGSTSIRAQARLA